jgi:hypothetical protein
MRRVRHPDARLYEESELPKEKALKHSFRWLYLTKFNTDGLEDLIRDTYGNPEETSFTFSAACVKILEWAKGWKSKSLARMLVRFYVILNRLLLIFYRSTYNTRRKGEERMIQTSAWLDLAMCQVYTTISKKHLLQIGSWKFFIGRGQFWTLRNRRRWGSNT